MQKSKILRKLESIKTQLAEVHDLIDESEAKLPKKAQKLLDERVCLACGEKIADDEREIRGCHERCYRKTYRAIERGSVTEREAIEAGLIAPQRKVGRSLDVDELMGKKR